MLISLISLFLVDNWGLGAGGGLLFSLLSLMHFTAVVKHQHLAAKSLNGDFFFFFKVNLLLIL